MFMLSNFLLALAKLIDFVLSAYIWVVIGRAIISWVNADPYNPVVRFLVQVTDPILSRIRRVIPSMGGIDLSPMVLILAIIFLQSFLVPTLKQIAMTLLCATSCRICAPCRTAPSSSDSWSSHGQAKTSWPACTTTPSSCA